MPACPYGTHRMTLTAELSCRRCGGDLRLYGVLRDLPIAFYNQARRLWDEEELEAASRWLHAALAAREGLAEAHWLLGLVEARQGQPEAARRHLEEARQLGAEVDPEDALGRELKVEVGPEDAPSEELEAGVDKDPAPVQELQAEVDAEPDQGLNLEAEVDSGQVQSQEPGDSSALEAGQQEGSREDSLEVAAETGSESPAPSV